MPCSKIDQAAALPAGIPCEWVMAALLKRSAHDDHIPAQEGHTFLKAAVHSAEGAACMNARGKVEDPRVRQQILPWTSAVTVLPGLVVDCDLSAIGNNPPESHTQDQVSA